MRQAYDYWQDQPGLYFKPVARGSRSGAGLPNAGQNFKNRLELAAPSEAPSATKPRALNATPEVQAPKVQQSNPGTTTTDSSTLRCALFTPSHSHWVSTPTQSHLQPTCRPGSFNCACPAANQDPIYELIGSGPGPLSTQNCHPLNSNQK